MLKNLITQLVRRAYLTCLTAWLIGEHALITDSHFQAKNSVRASQNRAIPKPGWMQL
jgi:hypothetical protein